MNYFQAIGFLFGGLTLSSVALYCVFGEVWKSMILFHICPEKRPRWLVVFSVLIVFWAGLTWALYSKDPTGVHLVISVYLSLGVIKAFFFIFKYDVMRAVTLAVVEKEVIARNILVMTSFVLGLGLVALGWMA